MKYPVTAAIAETGAAGTGLCSGQDWTIRELADRCPDMQKLDAVLDTK